MQNIFKVKNAKETVREVFINGVKQVNGERDFILTEDSIEIIGLKLTKGEKLTLIQETTITV